jgi:hypothetical protein
MKKGGEMIEFKVARFNKRWLVVKYKTGFEGLVDVNVMSQHIERSTAQKHMNLLKFVIKRSRQELKKIMEELDDRNE